MSYLSYAQNFEDVMLWRALKHVSNGVYVDVGAQHPVIDSVSKAFYERGWRGIHIEPVPEYAALLRLDRPDETVLQIAFGASEGTLDLNVIPDTGLSTAIDDYARRHRSESGFEHSRIQVPVLTMKSALTSLAGKDVHWLKIDVEGFEEKVLRGWDSQTLRPWVMVIEATIPNSPETDFASWDPILTAANYLFVYFDGLNRFYVASEHAELVDAFSLPPNVFDHVQLSGLASNELCRGLIAAHLASAHALNHQVETLTIEAAQRSAHAEERAALAEQRTAHAEHRTGHAEERTGYAEVRAAHAEERAAQAEMRTVQAHMRTAHAELRAEQAEAHAIELDAAHQASAQALKHQIETLTIETAQRTAHADESAALVEERAAQAKMRTVQAHMLTAHAELRAEQAEAHAIELDAAHQASVHALNDQIGMLTSAAAVRTAHAEERAVQAEMCTVQAHKRAAQAELRAEQAEAHAIKLKKDFIASRSWRLTAPLRYVRDVSSSIRQGRLDRAVKNRQQQLMRQLVRAVLRRSRMKKAARRILQHFPRLQARLYSVIHQTMASPVISLEPSLHATDLSPRTLRMYRALKKSLIARKN